MACKTSIYEITVDDLLLKNELSSATLCLRCYGSSCHVDCIGSLSHPKAAAKVEEEEEAQNGLLVSLREYPNLVAWLQAMKTKSQMLPLQFSSMMVCFSLSIEPFHSNSSVMLFTCLLCVVSDLIVYPGKTINDAGGFYTTAKSNGENAKLGCLVADEIPYLVAGSKNTCMVWPAEQPVEKYVPADNPSVPAQFICLLYSNWFLGLSKEQRSLFVSEMSQK